MIQLNVDDRTIDLAMSAALLHDIGLINGVKSDHAITSSEIFTEFINENELTKLEVEIIKQAILDHSNGNNIQSDVGLALVLADKLDVTYHRTINSSIQDEMNKEIQKIKQVVISITEKEFNVYYKTIENFNVGVFSDWPKAISIPHKVARYLNKDYRLFVNETEISIVNFMK